MVTLRERKTQYGIVINLPHDHTAATVNQAVVGAMAALPLHLKKTLTWDQGTEMARHLELSAATGIDIYFAERSSPWQRQRELQRTASPVLPQGHRPVHPLPRPRRPRH